MGECDFNVVLTWWQGLEHDRGGRAELRRAHNSTEIVFLPAYHRLYRDFRAPDKEALALVAGLCAHVKENRDGSIGKQMSEGDKPKVSGLRFRRLLSIKNRDELHQAMIRIIRQLGGVVNVIDLAKTVYWWNEKTKKELAYVYYANANAE